MPDTHLSIPLPSCLPHSKATGRIQPVAHMLPNGSHLPPFITSHPTSTHFLITFLKMQVCLHLPLFQPPQSTCCMRISEALYPSIQRPLQFTLDVFYIISLFALCAVCSTLQTPGCGLASCKISNPLLPHCPIYSAPSPFFKVDPRLTFSSKTFAHMPSF